MGGVGGKLLQGRQQNRQLQWQGQGQMLLGATGVEGHRRVCTAGNLDLWYPPSNQLVMNYAQSEESYDCKRTTDNNV